MTMEHKAFIFNYQAFLDELANFLESALQTGENNELINYIEANIELLKDPYEGEVLDVLWKDLIEIEDAHQYGDFAITKFYNPKDDIGLSYDWETLQDLLQSIGIEESIILGKAFGPYNNYFDPGKQGSYFQSSDQVDENLHRVNDLIEKNPDVANELGQLLEMLEQAFKVQKGLYITF